MEFDPEAQDEMHLLVRTMLDDPENPENLPPYDWLPDAKVYNRNYEKIGIDWLTDSVDVIVLYFSIRGTDRRGIIKKFYEIYENAKHANLPLEVINVPLDETKENMCIGFDEQANWFTLMFNDPLIMTLKYRYDITSVPHLIVLRTNGSVVSSHGILDLDDYGRNALITWLSSNANSDNNKRLSKELYMYGPRWKFQTANVGKAARPDYRRKFSIMPTPIAITTSKGLSVIPSMSIIS